MEDLENVMRAARSQVDLLEIYQQTDHIYTVEVNRKTTTAEEKNLSGVGARCKIKEREGVAYADRADKAVSEALELARSSSVCQGWTLPKGPFTYPVIEGLESPSLTTLSLDDCVNLLRGVPHLPENSVSAIVVHRTIQLVNNRGVAAEKQETVMEVSLSCQKGGYSWKEHTKSRDLISADTLEEMSKTTDAQVTRRKVQSAAVEEGDLLVPGHLSSHLFSRCVRTAFQIPSIVGRQVFSQDISLIDDGTLPGGMLSSPFDGEGVPCRRVILVDDGKVEHIMVGTTHAAKLHTEATGNIMRTSWQSSPSVAPHTLIFCRGCDKETLKDSVDKGILATRFKVFLPLLFERHVGDVFVIVDGFFMKNGDIEYPVTNVKAQFDFFTSLKRVSTPYEEYQQPYLQDLLFEGVKFS